MVVVGGAVVVVVVVVAVVVVIFGASEANSFSSVASPAIPSGVSETERWNALTAATV